MQKLLTELVAIPSVSSDIPQLHAVIDRIYTEFADIPWVYIVKDVANTKPYILVSNYDTSVDKKADILLSGHVDVVPASEDDQFVPRVEWDKMYARGTIDMKAMCTVMISTMQELLQTSYTDKKVMLMLTTDEEIGWETVGTLVGQWYSGDIVLVPDAGDTKTVITSGKGIYTMHISVAGKWGHSARPWLCTNAIDQGIKIYQELRETLQEDYELAQEDHRGTSIELTMIEAGTASNVIPDSADLVINIRHTEAYQETLLKNMCKSIVTKHGGTITDGHYGGLVHTDPDEADIQTYLEISQKHFGEDVSLGKMHGATDGRRFGQQGSIVIMQWLDWANLHTKNERVDMSGMEKLKAVMLEYIQS